MEREEVLRILRENIGAGDADYAETKKQDLDLASEDGVFTPESYDTYLDWLADLVGGALEQAYEEGQKNP